MNRRNFLETIRNIGIGVAAGLGAVTRETVAEVAPAKVKGGLCTTKLAQAAEYEATREWQQQLRQAYIWFTQEHPDIAENPTWNAYFSAELEVFYEVYPHLSPLELFRSAVHSTYYAMMPSQPITKFKKFV